MAHASNFSACLEHWQRFEPLIGRLSLELPQTSLAKEKEFETGSEIEGRLYMFMAEPKMVEASDKYSRYLRVLLSTWLSAMK